MKIKGYSIDEILLESDEIVIAKAVQESLDRAVFLKILPHLAHTQTLRDQFSKEARLLARLNHPNIVTIHEFNAESDPAYLVLEYFPGQNLADYLKQSQPIDSQKLINIMRQTVAGCKAAHAKDILHRDIKPANILIDASGQVKLTDFGLATLQANTRQPVVGTAGYIAPELALGERPTQLTDIYALGMTFYTLASGENPLTGKNLNDALNLAINSEPPDLATLRPDLPDDLIQLIRRMIVKNPSDRSQTCDQVGERLDEIVKIVSPPHQSQRGPTAFQSRQEKSDSEDLLNIPNRKDWMLGLLFFVMLILAIYSWSTSKRPDFVEPYVKYIPDTTSVDTTHKKASASPKIENTDTLEQIGQIPEKLVKNFGSTIPIIQPPHTVNDIIRDPPGPMFGSLVVAAIPWANIVIDSTSMGMTPIAGKLNFSVGKHTVHFMHPDYPDVTKEVVIQDGKTDSVLLNWRTELGFLAVNVFPWADVYVNSNHIDVTPLERPIALQPGEYQVLLKNPDYSPWHRFLTITAGDTESVTVKLRKSESEK